MMGEGLIWGMGPGHLIIVVLVVLLIAALVKYLFFELTETVRPTILTRAI